MIHFVCGQIDATVGQKSFFTWKTQKNKTCYNPSERRGWAVWELPRAGLPRATPLTGELEPERSVYLLPRGIHWGKKVKPLGEGPQRNPALSPGSHHEATHDSVFKSAHNVLKPVGYLLTKRESPPHHHHNAVPLPPLWLPLISFPFQAPCVLTPVLSHYPILLL